jgi:phosphonopyruvate decarboxylase
MNSKKIINLLKKNNINFVTGVPDSVLKPLIEGIDKDKSFKHIVSNNEGSAVSLGIGYQLSSKKLPCVYMQNSGLGNALNPLISIAHKKVYSIPLLLMIGWRGDPYNKKDEPQHQIKGQITTKILDLLGIKHIKIKTEIDLIKLKPLIQFSKKNNIPVACLIKRNLLSNKKTNKSIIKFHRREFLKKLLLNIKKKTKIISTTGYTSRDLMDIIDDFKYKEIKPFYMVGGMGHSAMVTLGSSLKDKNQNICLDGDGAVLMHLGSLNAINYNKKVNFKHIILNNKSHESVGGQKTYSEKNNFRLLSKSFGYKRFFQIKNNKNTITILKNFLKSSGPSMLEVVIKSGAPKNLPRPKNLIKIKENFIK